MELLDKYGLALLQLLVYSDNEKIIVDGITLDIKEELEEVKRLKEKALWTETLTRFIDSVTGLGYRLKMRSDYGGFFMVQVSRKTFEGKKYKSAKQTLGKDGFTEERLKGLINSQIEYIQKQIQIDEENKINAETLENKGSQK